MSNQTPINVIGAGLAGCEAAWQIAKRGFPVRLYEMKPDKKTPAHHTDKFAELVCSNSFRSDAKTNAVGLLKEELRLLGSLIMEAADATKVPAGSALAVDRDLFSDYITNKIRKNENIEIINEEISKLDDNITVVATGPLTSDSLSEYIQNELQLSDLHFFDAAAPIVSAESIDMSKAFFASRYNKGEASYLNCPMTKEEYTLFYNELINAEIANLKEFEKDPSVFEGCMPVEVMAKRGFETLLFGPLKPVGLPDPETGKEYFAVVQLRMENENASMFNLVGFQTNLKFPEQKRVFGLIPALKNAEYLRYGVMHRNTFIDSPGKLDNTYSLKTNPNLFFAGQMTGVEGYIESTASGFVAGINALMKATNQSPIVFPDITAIGALAKYVSDESITNFQPMNVNFGIIAPSDKKIKGGKSAKNEYLSERSLEYIRELKI